jgi:hypothetical protein
VSAVDAEIDTAVRPPTQSPRARWRPRRAEWALVTIPAVAIILWVIEWSRVDPFRMGGLGLISVAGPLSVVSLGVLIAGFAIALTRTAPEPVFAVYTIVFTGLLHAAPVLASGSLRLPWAWKHVGIVDYIVRHGTVDPGIEALAVYHNWPGFFAGAGVLEQLIGAGDVIAMAAWAPVAIAVATALALRFVFRALITDHRTIWLAIWLFTLLNWIGQDYFAPQALALFLYLLLVGVVLRWYRPGYIPEPSSRASRLTVVVLLMIGIGWNHQITPLMTILLLVVLVFTRRLRGWHLPLMMILITAAWALTAAREFTLASLNDLLVFPSETLSENLEKSEYLRGDALLVSASGRALTVVALVLAVAGAWRLLQRRSEVTTVALLAASPVLLLATTSFGGETLFRIVLFSLPFLSLLAAAAFYPWPGRATTPFTAPTRRTATAVAALSALLLPVLFVAYYGNDRQNTFTTDEIAVVRALYENAPSGSLLIEGNTNYPRDPVRYETFRDVSISNEDDSARAEIVADPVAVMSRWMSDQRYPASYFIITRAQKISADAIGPLPPDSLQRIEDTLRESPLFFVAYESSDAVVFQYVSSPGQTDD